MQLGVLGPVALDSGGRFVALGGPKQRLVLGLLTAGRGRVVSVDELIDGLWPEGPQARPRKTVQVYITRLRQAFGDVTDAIRSEAAGYRLDPAALDVDADEFERSMRTAMTERNDEVAATQLRAALSLWRGDAYADLRDCAAIVPSAVRLDELRLSAMHDLFEREIGLHPRSVIADLEQALEDNPLHEGFAAQLMTAQYRAGRQSDALQTYQVLRRRLADELGLEPGRALRELEGRILRHELTVAPAPKLPQPERQRRRVTIVAAEFCVESDEALTVDVEDEFALLTPVRSAARSRILGHGGLIISEGGDTLSACFGVPARDDSRAHAVAAALAIRDLVADSDPRLAVRIGTETGVAILEAPGADAGMAGAVANITGPPIRSAAQLRHAAAPNEVLLGPVVAGAVADEFVLEAAPSEAGDGVMVVTERRRSRRHRPHFRHLAGRDEALDELRALAAPAVDRLISVVIGGPPGIGKSAFVESFVGGLGPNWSVVALHGEPNQDVIALHPFRSALPDLFDDNPEPTARQVIAALHAHWDGLHPVLFVDRHDLLDPSSIELLDQLADHVATGMLILTTRELDPVELASEPVPRVSLRPLDRATTRRLVRRLAGDRPLPLATLNEIADRSGGVPLHVTELVRAMVDRQGPESVPTSLYDSLMWRLDRLGPARALAQRCAVLGDSFTDDDLGLLEHETPPTDLGEHLVTMLNAQIIHKSGGRYRFVDGLLAETAYDSMLNVDRVALHGRIAEAMSVESARREPERLAFHLEASGRPLDAAIAWRRASSLALRRTRNREAQHHARRALRLLDTVADDANAQIEDTRCRALRNLAIGLQATNHGSAELAEVTDEARRCAARSGARAGSSLVLDLIDVSNRQALGDFLGATDVARATLATAQVDGDELSMAFASQFVGSTLVWRGELNEGTAELESAVAFWDRSDAPDEIGARSVGALRVLLALVRHFEDRADDVVEMTRQAMAMITDEDGDGRCLVSATIAAIHQLSGDPATVRSDIEPIWPLAMDLGSEFWLGWAQVLLGWAIAADDQPTGLAMMTEAIDHVETRQAVPYFQFLLGSRLCEHGQRRDGLARLDAGIELAAATGEQLWAPLLLLERARWLDVEGDSVGATRDAAAALDASNGSLMIARRVAEWRDKR